MSAGLDAINDLAGSYWSPSEDVAQRVYDIIAHELAETIRNTPCHCWDSRDILADAIDPEVKP